MIYEQFYRALGCYLFAIAYSDGSIQNQETRTLDRVILHELSLRETGRVPDEKDVILAKLSFYNCLLRKETFHEARKIFLDFLKDHGPKIEEHHRRLAIRVIRKMAEAYKGANAGEAELVSEAEKLLKA